VGIDESLDDPEPDAEPGMVSGDGATEKAVEHARLVLG